MTTESDGYQRDDWNQLAKFGDSATEHLRTPEEVTAQQYREFISLLSSLAGDHDYDTGEIGRTEAEAYIVDSTSDDYSIQHCFICRPYQDLELGEAEEFAESSTSLFEPGDQITPIVFGRKPNPEDVSETLYYMRVYNHLIFNPSTKQSKTDNFRTKYIDGAYSEVEIRSPGAYDHTSVKAKVCKDGKEFIVTNKNPKHTDILIQEFLTYLKAILPKEPNERWLEDHRLEIPTTDQWRDVETMESYRILEANGFLFRRSGLGDIDPIPEQE